MLATAAQWTALRRGTQVPATAARRTALRAEHASARSDTLDCVSTLGAGALVHRGDAALINPTLDCMNTREAGALVHRGDAAIINPTLDCMNTREAGALVQRGEAALVMPTAG